MSSILILLGLLFLIVLKIISLISGISFFNILILSKIPSFVFLLHCSDVFLLHALFRVQ